MLLIRRQYAWLSELTDLTEGATKGDEERMRSLTDNDVKSVSSVPPQWVYLVGKQIQNVDGATHRRIFSA